MKLFLGCTSKREIYQARKAGGRNILISYAYFKKYYPANELSGCCVMLDSGAYSAYTLGIKIDINELSDDDPIIQELKEKA
ncbi:hypothetical protein D6827_03710, partial [Candidatus Parcubacteria bacterium]